MAPRAAETRPGTLTKSMVTVGLLRGCPWVIWGGHFTLSLISLSLGFLFSVSLISVLFFIISFLLHVLDVVALLFQGLNVASYVLI